MTRAITKTFLRQCHREEQDPKSKNYIPFRKWCKTRGKDIVEQVLGMKALGGDNERFPDGANRAVSKLCEVPMGEGAELAHMQEIEAQRMRKDRARARAAATKARRHEKSRGKKR